MSQQQITGFKQLASSGNQVLYPSGQPVYATQTIYQHGAMPKPLVKAGQWVWFDPFTGMSVASGDLASMNVVAIGLGIGRYTGGPADFLQTTVYDSINLGAIKTSSVQAPRCAQGPRGRLLIECVDCNQSIAVKIRYRNNNTEQFKDLNQWEEVVLQAEKACDKCADCTTVTDVSQNVCCLLEDSLKPQGVDFNIPTGGYGLKPVQSVPLTVTRISTGMNRYDFCLNPVADTCTNCTRLNNIIGVRWEDIRTGGTDEEPVLSDIDTFFDNTVDPGDTTKSFKDQMDAVIEQINADMVAKHYPGRAYRSHGFANNCCPEKITIISCNSMKLLTGTEEEATEVASCASADMLAAIAVPKQCLGCGDDPTAGSKTYKAGIEIAFDLLDYMCKCYPDSPGMDFMSIEYSIEVIGLDSSNYTWIEDQGMILPQNLGYQWMHRELTQEVGGPGRNQDYYTLNRGWYGEPVASSRVANLVSQCSESYCSWTMGLETEQSGVSVAGDRYAPRWEQVFLIPSKDTATLTPWQTMYNALMAASKAPVKGTQNCYANSALIQNPVATGYKLGE